MILIKIGGGKAINIKGVAEDIATLVQKERVKVIIVHGASGTRDEIAEKLGIKTKKITSPSGITSVYTDKEALDVFLMTYCGIVNKKIVAELQNHGVNAVGLSGIDGRLWEAKRKEAVYAIENGRTKLITDSLTGKVEKVNGSLLSLLCENGYVPVLCPPAISDRNEIVNTDNDVAVAVIARTLQIKKLVFLFEESGFLRDFHDKKSVISRLTIKELDALMESAEGTMKKKLLGTKNAFVSGVTHVYYGDGRMQHPILHALEGKGTVITRE